MRVKYEQTDLGIICLLLFSILNILCIKHSIHCFSPTDCLGHHLVRADGCAGVQVVGHVPSRSVEVCVCLYCPWFFLFVFFQLFFYII